MINDLESQVPYTTPELKQILVTCAPDGWLKRVK